ncbi:thiopurine S-methyltransferase [Psychrobacter aestuarii]|uniref:Thiopurine S-methyltransferase n=1 Tax=Psychrobacter aestuarii TaxID=556327 RepID=A0ABN0VMR8_9GAMM|nr:thiopurine S-methyltransferase [Psychrobacter aestuarii]
MTPDFWQNAWQTQQTGFNQSKPNAMLRQHFDKLNVPKQGRVFVPLCGKSVDMLWLLSQGYHVVGVELHEQAVKELFNEHGLSATVTAHPTQPNLKQYRADYQGQTLTIWAGNLFDVQPDDIGQIDGIYDRAALVALPDDAPERMRWQYTQHLGTLTGYAPQLLLAFSYDDDSGITDKALPPFLVTREALDDYYAAHYDIQLVAKEKAEYVSTRADSGYRLAYVLTA